MPRKRKPAQEQVDPATAAFEAGAGLVGSHPLFRPIYAHTHESRPDGNGCPADAWAVVTPTGRVLGHPTRCGAPEEWAYVLAHCLLHLGFGHHGVPEHVPAEHVLEWNAACDCYIARFLAGLKIGRPPASYLCPPELQAGNEQELYRRILERGLWPGYVGDLVERKHAVLGWSPGRAQRWADRLATGLADSVTSAVRVAAGVEPVLGASASKLGPLQQARAWLITSYPLLGALAAGFTLIQDARVCSREGISIAAVDDQIREVYFSPAAGLSRDEYRFVLAHELLHVGLRHSARRQGRDPYLFNVAADYVVNGWLIEMGIGRPPRIGILHDPKLKGLSVESVYDLIVTDLRRCRKLMTLRGVGVGDILDRRSADWWTTGAGLDLDEFYRRCLAQGLLTHEEQGRGLLPEGLLEEIQALALPPIPWDVALARWFDERFAPLEKVRSYARPSRRQAATPDIPRPSYVVPAAAGEGRTFGVLLDTSGSMGRNLLAKALGAIAGYALAHDVPVVRVVFCDAAAYDQGYVPVETIADRVRVRGRGGTVLQPGIDLLARADDFPREAPLLVITDGYCDALSLGPRDHAFLLPEGHGLPFAPQGKVFRIPS